MLTILITPFPEGRPEKHDVHRRAGGAPTPHAPQDREAAHRTRAIDHDAGEDAAVDDETSDNGIGT